MHAKISVLLGAFNCELTLGSSIETIAAQTYTNWELIICDDGSTDNTYKVAEKYSEQDSRIILLRHETNCGLNKTLNDCLSVATGKYIARMDGDDVCHPERFEKQVSFLEQNPKYSIVSSRMYLFDEDGRWGETKQIESPSCRDIVEGSPICHAPVLMWKLCMDSVNGYSENIWTRRVEDVDLWIKLYAVGYRCFNLQEPLYGMRNDKNAFNRRKYRYRVNSTIVRLRGCRILHLKPRSYILSFRPMLIGLVPARIRRALRKR